MTIDMSQFYQVFFEESSEHLAAMEGLLLNLDVDRPDLEQLNAIFRAAHSIKGSAGTFGFSDLADTTHILENLLDRIRKNELVLRPDMVDAFLECGDVLRSMLEAHQGRGEVDAETVEAITARLKRLSDSTLLVDVPSPSELSVREAGATVSSPSRVFDIRFIPTEISASGHGVANLLDELRSLGDLEVLGQPADGAHVVGYWRLRLRTDSGTEGFSDQIDFIADSGNWRVDEVRAVNDVSEGEEAFGLFSDAPGSPAADQGYGFFDQPETLPAVAGELVRAEEEGAYGFFQPLALGSDVDSGLLHGAADATPADGVPAPLPDAKVPDVEEGDGYGLFLPLNVAGEPLRKVEAPPLESVHPEAPVGGGATPESSRRVAKQVSPPVAGGDSSIRVSVEKVDQLINLVGELVITQAMLLQTAVKMQEKAPERLLHGLAQLERNTRDLQESVMSIRMMPISFVFSRFPRVVRDLSGKLGKQVELKTSGETTELDKNLIERIADPLTHLIRNSLDHGIELPERRVAAGKDPMGTITLKAYHQGGNIVIEVGDDGAGLPRNKILAKARERGLQVSDQMTDPEVFNLIFEAGFSTADQVTDVSGRGVGMDVVRRNIQSMGGRVEIESMPGIGTRMTVRLPLTLAILDGMSIAVGDQTYILPLSYVIESFQPQVADIKTLSNQARVIQVRGEYLPVVVLHELFNLKPVSAGFSQGIMIVIDADGIKAALFVDALVGQHQVVIKSLEANYRRVHGISGATIMGDGHVALILDVSAIAGMARSCMQRVG